MKNVARGLDLVDGDAGNAGQERTRAAVRVAIGGAQQRPAALRERCVGHDAAVAARAEDHQPR
jgi:hypothetical protein